MKTPLLAFACLLFAWLPNLVSSQNPNLLLSYKNSDSLFVCGVDTFNVTVQNIGAALPAGAVLNITLPNGVFYVAGSVFGASQQNIGNLQSPVFGLPAIAANSAANIRLLLTATCTAAGVLDAGGLFIANIAVSAPNASAAVVTNSMPVETGLILIESVADLQLEGERLDTLYRKICIKNTRLGKIGGLLFEDKHAPGLEISVAGASTQSNTASLFKASYDGSIFAGVGNGDHWLDLGESVCFSEKIIITDCGMPEVQNNSLLRVGWGCSSTMCRYDSLLAKIKIKPSTRVPNLAFNPIWSPPADHCAGTGALNGLKIVNNGRSAANNVSIKFKMTGIAGKTAINPSSFRLVRSNGSTVAITPNAFSPAALTGCTAAAASDVTLYLSLIEPMDSVNLLFDVLYCIEDCEQQLPEIVAEYFYAKPCPVNGFVSGSLKIKPDKGYLVKSYLNFSIGACLQPGVSYPGIFSVKSKRLREAGGFFNVEFDLPPGMALDEFCPAFLSGIAPFAKTVLPNPDSSSTVRLSFELPLPFDTAKMDICVRYECDSNLQCLPPPGTYMGQPVVFDLKCQPCFVKLNERSYWAPQLNTPYQCGIGDCKELFMVLDRAACFEDDGNTDADTSIIVIPTPADKYRWKADVERINYGLRDKDDNRLADNGTKALPSEIRLDRFLPGDTMRVSYCGALDSGIITTLTRIIWHEVATSDLSFGSDPYNSDLARQHFTNSQNLRLIRDSLRIHYADGTKVGLLVNDIIQRSDKNIVTVLSVNSFPPVVLDELVSQRHLFADSLFVLFAKGLLPKPYIEVGDSVFCFTDFKMDMNFNALEPGKADPPLIGFRTAYGRFGGKYAGNSHPFTRLQYSGFIIKNSANTFNIRPCEPSLEAKKFRHAVRIARENMFPFEVRPLTNLVHYGQTLPPGLSVQSAKLAYLALQDSVPRLSNLPLTFSQSPGYLELKFDPAFAQPIDEGFQLGANIVFEPNCNFKLPTPSTQWAGTRYNACLKGELPVYIDTLHNDIGFFASYPRLQLLTSDSVVNAPTRLFELTFNLKNPIIPPVASAWVSVQSSSGQVSDINLYKMPANQLLNAQNGIFNLGAINGLGQSTYRLTGKNLSCETDSLRIVFGWDCGPVANIDQNSCFRDTFVFRLNLLKPELELDVLKEPAAITLCDTSDYFEFEIFNAKTGYAYEPFGAVKLPDGLRIVPGSSELFYPAVGAWASIADPDLLAGNLYRWDVSQSQPLIGANGLPGINLAPQNSLRIRFKTIADCGFVSNAQNIYGAYGKEPCGRSTNILNKPGERLKILGLNPTYGVVLGLQAQGNQAGVCGGEQAFNAQITLLGTPSVGDSAVVTLPQGATYVIGSYLPGQNAPAGQPTITPTGFRIALPMLQGGGNLQFGFMVAYEPGSGCIDQTISLQTRVRTEAFCQSLGTFCDVYVSTGEYNLNLSIQHPELNITGAQANISGGQLHLSVGVSNIGQFDAPGAVAQIWMDADGSQTLSAGDVLLHTLSSNQVFGPGGSLVLSGSINGSPTALCGLMVLLPAAENCACSTVTVNLNTFTVEHDTVALCSLEAVSVGVDPMPSFSYQWHSDPSLACETCATTIFTPASNTPPGQVQHVSLLESSANCSIEHHFSLEFGAAAGISTNNAVICAGKTAALTASPANATYYWQGAGIQNPALPMQAVSPPSTAEYSLTVTLPNGCSATTTALITVLPADTVSLPVLEACEGSFVQVFGNNTLAANQTFKLGLLKLNGCDSIILQPVKVLPKPQTAASVSFCQGDTLILFDSLAVTGSTQVCREFIAANGCDSTHCISAIAIPPPMLPAQDTIFAELGQPIQLGGLPGYASYVWEPAPVPPCPNCPAITITLDSAGIYEYLLTVKDANGCQGSLIWRVVAAPPCDPQDVEIPNAFTPNNDGANDVFMPVNREGGVVFGKMTIYDRWGEKVYESQVDIAWDGRIKGVPASSDVYIYIIEVECANGKMAPRVGEVNLLR